MDLLVRYGVGEMNDGVDKKDIFEEVCAVFIKIFMTLSSIGIDLNQSYASLFAPSQYRKTRNLQGKISMQIPAPPPQGIGPHQIYNFVDGGVDQSIWYPDR